MPILYSDTDKRFWLYQPQLTRWRNPFRGARNSERISQEANQIQYDIYRLNQRSSDLNDTIKDLSDKLINGYDYSGSFLSNHWSTDLLGIDELSVKIENLRNRIRGLE